MPEFASTLSIRLHTCPRCKQPPGQPCRTPKGRPLSEFPAHGERMQCLTPAEWKQCEVRTTSLADILRGLKT